MDRLGAPIFDVQYVSCDTETMAHQIPEVVLTFAQDQCNHVTFLTGCAA